MMRQTRFNKEILFILDKRAYILLLCKNINIHHQMTKRSMKLFSKSIHGFPNSMLILFFLIWSMFNALKRN